MGTRAYLRPDDRRRQLLDAVSRLFDRGGLAAITVSAAAAEAGTSRRLVYDHFADLGDLYTAFFEDRVARYAAVIDAASTPTGEAEPRSLTGAFRQLLEVPPEDLRALHLLVADRSTPELASARDALGLHLRARWLPALGALGFAIEVADAALWMVVSSFITLAELVQRGELAPVAAEALAVSLVRSLPDAAGRLVAQPAPVPECS